MEVKKQNIRIIYPVAFVGDLTLSMLLVLSVLYATNVGLSTIEVGLIGSAYGFAYLFMPAILGRVSDKFSRKISLIIATSGHVILSLFFLIFVIQPGAYIFYGLFLILFIYGIIYGFFWPSIEAYVSEHTEHSSEEHEKGIANFCISWSIGFAVGPFLAGIFHDINIVFGLLLVCCAYIFAFCLILLKMPKIKPTNKGQSTELNNHNNQVNFNSNAKKILILLAMGVMIYGSISKTILSYFTNYAALPEGLNWTGTLIGQVMFFFGLGRTFYFMVARYLRNSFTALTQSFLVIGICLIALALFYSPTMLAIIFFITGFFIGRSYLVSLELLLKFEQEKKGAKAGIFESIVGIGSAISPLFAGMIASINLMMPFYIFAFIVFLFVIIHLILKKNTKLEENNKNN